MSKNKPTFESNRKFLPELHAMMEVICVDHFYPPDFFADFPQSRKVIELDSVAVHANYRKRGIATELMKQGIKVQTVETIFRN